MTVVKPILVKGEFPDMGQLLRIAYCEGKKIFKTKKKINVVHPPIETPYGYIVLVALHQGMQTEPLMLGAETGDK